MKITNKILVACLPGIVAGALFAASTGERTDNKPNTSAMTKAKNALAKLPLSFEPNRGQTDPRVQFLSRGPGYAVFFTQDETVINLRDTNTSNAVVRMRFVGGTNSASAHPIDALPGATNYLVGNDSSKWLNDVPEYTKLRYENVYPGIDVLYQGDQKQLRYDFIVKPGANASAIQMAFQGADSVSVNKDGDLVLTIDGKTLVTTKPFTYQEDAGAKKEVASHFVVKNGRVSFELAKYDTTKDLVIDPSVVFVTFLGGTLNDSVNGVAIVNPTLSITSSPSAYFVTGTTFSSTFPTTAGVLPTCGSANAPPVGCDPSGLTGTVQSGVSDVFVTKISFNGGVPLWSTYLGGNSQDSGAAIAVDIAASTCAAGCPIVAGQTFSANFPTVPFQGTNGAPALQGGNDAFAAKLNFDGKSLIYSTYLGGIVDDQATGVAVNTATGDAFIGGYTDSPQFLCTGTNAATCNNHGVPTSSSDGFVVKIPVAYNATSTFSSLITSTLYGGFGEEFAHAIAFNPTNQMIYLGGDTTTAAQNYIAPNNVNLPGITNNTANTGLPGAGPNARGGFVAAFDATTLVKTFATYVAVSPIGSTGTESITGIAAEGGTPAPGCSTSTQRCTASVAPTAPITAPYGDIGHVYITGATTSKVPSSAIAIVVDTFACQSSLAASSTNPGVQIIGPTGTPITTAGGTTIPTGCVTSLITQAPFATNQAAVAGCPYPVNLPLSQQTISATCNSSAYVAILDGALLIAPVPGATTAGIGNQIEYWAYYSSANASTASNALAIDSNPTTLTSVYSLGTYQQMYITGSTQQTVAGAANLLPVTNVTANPPNSTSATPSEIFTTYNVGTTIGGGVGGYTPNSSGLVGEIDAYVARFNANGLAASTYGGQGNAVSSNPNPMGYGCPIPLSVYGVPCTGQIVGPVDHSMLIHTPQFNYGEYIYGEVATDGSSTPNTVGNAIAVDPTRATIIGGATNVSVSNAGKLCTPAAACNFATTNSLSSTSSGQNDGWVSVLFFNDILTNAASQSTANPWIQPGAPQLSPQPFVAGANANGSYIETAPAPFGPTFDFAISDASTQTQTFQVLFTGQAAGQLVGTTPWFIPLDSRTGANPPTFDNNLPGSGIAYYVPCENPATIPTSFAFNPSGAASQAYFNNAYPAPGTPYGPMTCAFPSNHLYEGLPTLFSGYPGVAPGAAVTTPGWLLVSQDINPGVVRLQLDRRAAAGLLEGTYVAQFLVTTYDSQHQSQWPPCGPPSVLNPYPTAVGACTNAATPLPADNASVLITVRLVVRPTLFLSRNAGLLTGITSSLSLNPLSGPAPLATLSTQDGTSRVPNWLYTGATNDIVSPIAPATLYPGTLGLLNVNAGPPTCVAGTVPALNWSNPGASSPGTTVTVPCPITATDPAPFGGAIFGATAYLGNGPGDGTVGNGPGPNITFLYDSGTIQSPNISVEQSLVLSRPDLPVNEGAPNFNADSQGGIDPLSQRNDATVHKYYTTAEGAATLSVAAINCTNFTNPAVGNWLSVDINATAPNGQVGPNYVPICTNLTATTIGTQKAPATFCRTGCSFNSGIGIGDDQSTQAANYPLGAGNNGQQIPLDFLTTPFSNRKAYNGIPTGVYTAQVYVWSTRAKNTAPGYCLGSSIPISPAGVDPTPLCPGAGTANSANPNPLVAVSNIQTFNVTLVVFDTTQVIQLTPSTCQTAGTTVTEFATVANSENILTGNITPPFGPGSLPNYTNFGPNGNSLVEWSLLPFQTTGQGITGSCNSNGLCGAGTNVPIPLPNGVTVNPQTLAQYNACFLPTGTANGVAINGGSVPGIGSLLQTGPLSQTTFFPASSTTSSSYTLYACRPTVAPAWLNSTLYPGNALIAPGGPEPYANGNGPFDTVGGGAVATVSTFCGGATGALGCPNGAGPVPSVSTLTCPLANGAPGGGPTPGVNSKIGVFRNGIAFVLDKTGANAFLGVPPAVFNPNFFSAGFGGVFSAPGDIGVSGDWTGSGTFRVGIYRPSTGQWYLDVNGDGIYNAGDLNYAFGGITGDIPVVGDWSGLGKSCVGLFRSGFLWVLDLNCNGTFDGTGAGQDTAFGFGGLAGDVPVVGAFTGAATKVGIVRAYAPAGVQLSPPFLWVLDNAAATDKTQADHVPAAGAFPYGGVSCTSTSVPGCATANPLLTSDMYVTGDWQGTGTYHAGIYRAGHWILDLSGAHTYDTFYNFGGLATDTPVVGKW